MPNLSNVNLTQEEWETIETEFLQGFYRYFDEFNDSIQLLRKNKDNPLIKSQLCLALIAIDTFSRFHLILQGERDMKKINESNEKRFKQWLNDFVFTAKNESYKKHKGKIKCDAGVVWRLRNSFLHFYSLPELKAGQAQIGFSFNVPYNDCRKMEEGLKREHGRNVVIIDAYHLIDVIFQGLILQWEGLVKMIKEKPDEYYNSVIFAHRIVMQEGASTIKLNRSKKKA